MHPNPLFRHDDDVLIDAVVDDIGFAMIFITTPDGPRVAHTPLMSVGGGRFRFHLSRRNALVPHLAGNTALIVANGAHGYVSPRWYADRDTVPTWDYLAVELEGPVTQLDEPALEEFLCRLIARHEARLGEPQWSAAETSAENWARQRGGIVGFEIAVEQRRPTVKLSQKQPAAVQAVIAAGQRDAGNAVLAATMERFGP